MTKISQGTGKRNPSTYEEKVAEVYGPGGTLERILSQSAKTVKKPSVFDSALGLSLYLLGAFPAILLAGLVYGAIIKHVGNGSLWAIRQLFSLL